VSNTFNLSTKRKDMASTPSPVLIRNRFQPLQTSDDDPTEGEAGQGDLPATWSHGDIGAEAVITHVTPSQRPGPLSFKNRRTTVASQPLSGDSSETHGRVFVHEGPKDTWTLNVRPLTAAIVIGDSNLRHVDPSSIPEDWEVYACPGAKYRHVIQLLSNYQERLTNAHPDEMLEHIIIQVGINHRDDNVDNVREEVVKMEQLAIGLARFVSVVGISVASSLNESTRKNVDRLNQLLARGSLEYIPPMPSTEVVIRQPDYYGIHFDGDTVTRFVKHIINKVRELSLN
jgi:hypothetical protein